VDSLDSIFDAKTSEFFEIYGVSPRTRGVEPERTVCGQGDRVRFSQFCADVLYGRAPYIALQTVRHRFTIYAANAGSCVALAL